MKSREEKSSQKKEDAIARKCTFSSSGVEKLHAAVARSTFSSQNVQNTSGADPFLKFRCGKRARRCSEKYICK